MQLRPVSLGAPALMEYAEEAVWVTAVLAKLGFRETAQDSLGAGATRCGTRSSMEVSPVLETGRRIYMRNRSDWYRVRHPVLSFHS
jgi:hypothetical protein